jgi:hypothetical protein
MDVLRCVYVYVCVVCVMSCADDSLLTFGIAVVRTFLPRLKMFTVSEFLLNRNRLGSAVSDIELEKK